MRVAITGAAGYIGGWLMAELAARGHEVHAQDLASPDVTTETAHWATFTVFDMHSQPARATWFQAAQPEAVIHLAALYGRVWGEKDLVKTVGANTGLTAELARDCTDAGIRLMFMSSSEVYGASADRGTVYPTSPLEPLNMYGMSKKWGEEAAWRYAPSSLMVTRLNMPYGPSYFVPRKGERPATSGRPGTVGYNVLHSMVWEAEQGLPLVVHRGTERCLTWVGDTVRGLAMILESGQSGTWNVNRNDDHHPIGDLAQQVLDVTGSMSVIEEQDPPSAVTVRKSLDNTRLLSMGWRPEVELDEGIKRTWEYYRRFDREGVWQG